MFSFAKFIALAVLAVSVVAQDETETASAPEGSSTAGISACIIGCGSEATQCELTDVQCVCTNVEYQASVTQCIQDTCPDELEAATAVSAAQCAGIAPDESGTTASETASETGTETGAETGTETGTETGAETATATTPTGTGTSTSTAAAETTNAGLKLQVGSSGNVIYAAAAIFAGIGFGGFLA